MQRHLSVFVFEYIVVVYHIMQGTLRIANVLSLLLKNIIELTILGGENINEREKIFVF